MTDSGDQIFDELDKLADHFAGGLDDDERLDDGVPEKLRSADLGFIQMSGVARPDAPDADDGSGKPDTDTSRPLSFFEEGVADVDSRMAPDALESGSRANDEIVPEEGLSDAPIKELRDIIAELRDAASSEPEPEAPPEPWVSDEPLVGADEDADVTSVPEPEGTSPGDLREAERLMQELQGQIAAPDPSEETQAEAEESEPAEESEDVAPQVEPEEATAERGVDEVTGAAALPDEPDERVEESDGLDETVVDDAELAAAFEPEAEQPDDLPPPVVEDSWTASDALVPTADSLASETTTGHGDEESLYAKPSIRRGQRRSGLRRKGRRKLLRLVALVVALACVGSGGYFGWRWAKVQFTTADQLYGDAAALAKAGDYREAANAFAAFASSHPTHPLRPEAQFMAAHCTQGISPPSDRQAGEALAQFEQFIQDNPEGDPAKLARAQIVIGMLHFRLGRMEQALDILSDPELLARDPKSRLAVLRACAGAQAKQGQFDAAVSLYREAIAEPLNRTPDKDHAALAELYETLSHQAVGPDEQSRYRQLAGDEWRAIATAAIVRPADKDYALRRLEKLAGEEPAAPDGAAPPTPEASSLESGSAEAGGTAEGQE
ncbi:MAG: tetratricopeptide repeat protein [bacterium]|nr:tetratricopeptide repeat protein [bacterium]